MEFLIDFFNRLTIHFKKLMKPFSKYETCLHSSVDGRLPDVDYVNNRMMNIEPIDSGLADFLVIFLKKDTKSNEFGLKLKENVFQVGQEIVIEVFVEKVSHNSVAKTANIQSGDQIVQINSEFVTSKQNAENLLNKFNKAVYINIIRLHEMYRKSYSKDKRRIKSFCYPFSSMNERNQYNNSLASCSNQASTNLCYVLIEKLKRHLSLNDERSASECRSDLTENVEPSSPIGSNTKFIETIEKTPSENMDECFLMYTSPRHLAKTIRIQQEIYKRLILAKKNGTLFQESSDKSKKNEDLFDNSKDPNTSKESSKWVIRKRYDGTRYVTKRIDDKKGSENKDHIKVNRRLIPCQLPIKSDSTNHGLVPNISSENYKNNEENILSVMIL